MALLAFVNYFYNYYDLWLSETEASAGSKGHLHQNIVSFNYLLG